jgi:L,D-peptidoglycan transpeptidase YkuD (ErfK/YbiS/YcfS/YnhG family)
MGRALVGADGLLRYRRHVLRVALGRGGVSRDKREGDGATPAGLLPLRKLIYRADRVAKPASAVPAEPMAPTDGWCDDPADRDYNRQITLPHEARHEVLWRRDGLYDIVVVLGWNDLPVIPGRGSAIFMHVARTDYAPTEGCLALALTDLLGVLADDVTEVLVS